MRGGRGKREEGFVGEEGGDETGLDGLGVVEGGDRGEVEMAEDVGGGHSEMWLFEYLGEK